MTVARGISSLNLNQLVALEALLTVRNVRRAAERLGITQSALSHTLKALRILLDDPLLVRVGNQMELTSYAQAITAPLRRGLAELETVVKGRAAFRPEAISDEFVLAAHDGVAVALLSFLYERLREEAPRAKLKIVAFDPSRVEEQLLTGEIDVALSPPTVDVGALHVEPVLSTKMRVVVSPQHTSIKETMTLEEYCGSPHVVVSITGAGDSFVDELLRKEGRSRTIAVRVPYLFAVPDLVRRSDLIGTVPQQAAAYMARRWGLSVFAAPFEFPRSPMFLCWHPRHDAEPAGRFFRRIVLGAASDADEAFG